MYEKPFEQMEQWAKPSKAAFEFWISMWPVAPLFGVEWRFAEAMSSMTALGRDAAAATTEIMSEGPANFTAGIIPMPEAAMPGEPVMPKPARPKPQPAPKPVLVAEPVAEPDPVPEPDPAPAPEVAAEPDPAVTAAPEEAFVKPGNLLDAAPDKIDDLKLVKGIGPALEKQLNGLGVYTFSQMAAFSEDDLKWIDENLTAFKGRCFRDDWIGQAKDLID